jgi:triacylglycerol lipase
MLRPAARTLSAVAVELGWVTAHLATYPLGLIRESGDQPDPGRFNLTDLSPVERGLLVSDVTVASTPVVLVHGAVDNRTIFAPLRRSLRRRGFRCVRMFSYSPRTTDVRDTAVRFGDFVEETCARCGSEQVFVVGHSLGGLVARYYVQRQAGHARVDTLVTLGSPHGGTRTAHLLPHRLARQLRTDGDVVEELRLPAAGCTTRFLAVYSEVDHLIVPARNGAIDHPDLDARNVAISAAGHLSLPIHGRVIHQVCTTLAAGLRPRAGTPNRGR